MFFKDVVSKEKADRIRKERKPISFREIAVIISRAEITLKGTIKAHNEYDGEKQTVLTRCKILAGA